MSQCHPPYPMSKYITGIEWAPISQITRLAHGWVTRDGSDNWPMTWADDDNQYTSYGDGFGFCPIVEKKLGMGFAKIVGDVNDFNGINIRSDAENTEYGKNNRKGSGMLMVDGVLYLFARNDNRQGEHSRLARSNDYAKTWSWCDWNFAELGHPAFINFGKNYAGARDGYVYVWSHDNSSAYTPADHFVLARVPKEKLRERNAYEFVEKVDDQNQPTWTADISKRGPVFRNEGYCMRSSMSYNAPLKRYLMWHNFRGKGTPETYTGKVDIRYKGGFGVFEAPEPWGPWHTVYYIADWDVGPGDLGCFPTKWMSKDGKTIRLVFAGNDNFSARKATLTVKP